MQIRSLLVVPLFAVLPIACKSSESHPEEDSTTGMAEISAPVSAEPDANAHEPAVAVPASAEIASTDNANATTHAQDQGSPAGDAERAQRMREQGTFLSGEYLKQGNAQLERGDLPAALKSFANALDLDPASQAARDQMHKVQALLGDQYAGAAGFLQDATEREVVRRAQARMAAEDARVRGKNALAAGDYPTAIEQYRQAEMILRYNPLIESDSYDHKIARSELDLAVRMAEDAKRVSDAKSLAAAEEARARKEREEKEYRENRLRTLYDQANAAFLAEDYATAESKATQILLDDPSNKAASDLRQIARDMRHGKTDEENRAHYREQWIRTFEELDTMGVPQNDTLVFNDLQRWRIVSQRKPLEFSQLDPVTAADKQVVLDRLDATRVEPKFLGADGNGSPLEDVAVFLQQQTGVNFLISPKVMTELDDEQRTIKFELSSRSVRKVLDLIAETHENLRWKVEDGIVKFVTKDEMKGGQILRTYGVQDLIRPIPDFPGREMNVAPTGGVQLAEEEKVEHDANVITSDALQTLITSNVAAASWQGDPANSLRINNGTMVVHQTPEVLQQIEKLLKDLREATGILVDIQARFLKVEDNFLEDIGVDFRGLGQPGLGTNAFFNDFGDASTQQDLGKEIGQGTDLGAFYDKSNKQQMQARVEELYDTSLGDTNVLTGSGGLALSWTYLNDIQLQLILRAVNKSERIELVTSPRITVHNTARGNLSVLNQVAYVQDFNVEIAQAASIADPIVNVVQDGVVLDVRPMVSADRRFITLELRPTIATLKRPIREVVTTLGSQNSVTIQLPEVEIQRVRTSIPMPDGGTVLLGGLKVSDKQDLDSGVPILNKIPVLSFFFSRKGNYVSNRKLLVLLKANIVIPSEQEPTPAQLGPPDKN